MDLAKSYNGCMTASLDFFGTKEGQSKIEFAREFNQLTNEAKKEIEDGLKKLGYKIG